MNKQLHIPYGKICACVAVIFGMAAFFMIFAPAAVASAYGRKIQFMGYELAFGDSRVGLFKASANICTYVLLFAGTCFAAATPIIKSGRTLNIVSAVAFAVAGVFHFLAIPLSNFEAQLFSSQAAYVNKYFYEAGIGSILGCAFSSFAAALAAASAFLK